MLGISFLFHFTVFGLALGKGFELVVVSSVEPSHFCITQTLRFFHEEQGEDVGLLIKRLPVKLRKLE